MRRGCSLLLFSTWHAASWLHACMCRLPRAEAPRLAGCPPLLLHARLTSPSHRLGPAPPACLQNFECGMGDAQLERLAGVLRRGRIWALNAGENFRISRKVGVGCARV